MAKLARIVVLQYKNIVNKNYIKYKLTSLNLALARLKTSFGYQLLYRAQPQTPKQASATDLALPTRHGNLDQDLHPCAFRERSVWRCLLLFLVLVL